jgi:hypothetical protein
LFRGRNFSRRKAAAGDFVDFAAQEYQPIVVQAHGQNHPAQLLPPTSLGKQSFAFIRPLSLFSLFPHLVEFVSTRAALLCKVCQ